jgi:hypothetical protein
LVDHQALSPPENREQIANQILEADCFFGPLGFDFDGDDDDDDDDEAVPPPPVMKKQKENNSDNNKENALLGVKTTDVKTRRQSTIANVRRSSRFFPGSSAPLSSVTSSSSKDSTCLGSVFTNVEIIDRKAKRRSSLAFPRPNFKIALINRPSLSCSPLPCEEALKLIKDENVIVEDMTSTPQ